MKQVRETAITRVVRELHFQGYSIHGVQQQCPEMRDVPQQVALLIQEQDARVEGLWESLGDIPVDDDGYLEEEFLHWGAGVDREDVWHWFDSKHSKGVVYLMGVNNG